MDEKYKYYGEGFVDGFNAALRSNEIKELEQNNREKDLLLQIKDLKNENERLLSQMQQFLTVNYNYLNSINASYNAGIMSQLNANINTINGRSFY